MNKKNKNKTETIAASETGGLYYQGHIYQDILKKKEFWNEIANKYNGNLRIIRTRSNDLNRFKLEINHANHELIITESDSRPLKLETVFNLNTEFEFYISREDTLEKIFKLFGKKEIEIGHEEFDKRFLIKSNNEEILRKLFSSVNITNLTLESNIYLINLVKTELIGNYKLMFVKDRSTKDFNSLKELVELQFRIIDFFIDNNLLVK